MALRRELGVSEWRTEINNGLRYRLEHGLEDSWTKLEAAFYGVKDKDSAGPNIIAATGDSLLSALTVPYPRIRVIPKRQEYVAGAMVVEALDNHLLEELKIPVQVEMAVHHAFLWGAGFLKLGYDSQFGYAPGLEIGEGIGATLSQFDRRGNRLEAIANPGMPWLRSCLPHDIVVPWGTVDIDEAPWVAHRVVRHVDEIKSDSKYRNVRDLEPMMSMEDFVKSYTTVQKPYRTGETLARGSGTSKAEYCELYEIHDRRTGRIKVIVTGHKSFLRDEEDALQIDGQPFISVGFVPRARTLWVTPDSFYLRQAQAELNDISLTASKQRRIACLKFLVARGAMKEEELTKVLSTKVGIAAFVEQGTNLRDAIQMIGDHNNASLYQDAEHVRMNAREAVGFSRNQTGQYAGARTTATEVGVVDRASLQRLSRRQTVLRRTYISVFQKLNQVIFSFWGLPRVESILGPTGAQRWIEFTGPQVKGDYAYELSFSDEIIPSQQERERQALEMYYTLAQDPMVDQVALREFLSNAYNSPSLRTIFGATQNAPIRPQLQGVQGREGSTPSDKTKK